MRTKGENDQSGCFCRIGGLVSISMMCENVSRETLDGVDRKRKFKFLLQRCRWFFESSGVRIELGMNDEESK